MIEMVKQIWTFGLGQYFHEHPMFALACWLICWGTMQMCIFTLLLWTTWRLAPHLEKAVVQWNAWRGRAPRA